MVDSGRRFVSIPSSLSGWRIECLAGRVASFLLRKPHVASSWPPPFTGASCRAARRAPGLGAVTRSSNTSTSESSGAAGPLRRRWLQRSRTTHDRRTTNARFRGRAPSSIRRPRGLRGCVQTYRATRTPRCAVFEEPPRRHAAGIRDLHDTPDRLNHADPAWLSRSLWARLDSDCPAKRPLPAARETPRRHPTRSAGRNRAPRRR